MPTDFDRAPNRREKGRTNKWNYYPPDVLPLWVADMDFPSPKPIRAALHKAVDHGVLGYELPPHALQETVTSRLERLYHWRVAPEAVITVPGIVSGVNVAARAFCTKSRGYLFQIPAYNAFHDISGSLSIPKLEAPLVESAKSGILRYEIDWEAFEKQVRKAGIFLLCSPHNPVGKVFSRSELSRMARLCIDNDVVIVSDEIHSELMLEERRFSPMVNISKEIAEHTVTMVSPSKSFNIPGLFCGFAVISSEKLRKRYSETLENLHVHVSSLSLFAAQAAFSGECDEWLGQLRAYLLSNRNTLEEYVRLFLPEIKLTRPQATYLTWLDCGELVKQGRIQGSPFEHFLNKARVAFSDGKIYSSRYPAYVRVNFGCTRRTLVQALERVRKSL